MKLASGFCIPEPLPVHTGIKGRQVHPLIRFLLRSWVDEKCADLHKPFISYLFLVFVMVQSAESLSGAIPLGTSTKRANSKRANHRLFQDAILSVSFWLRSFPVRGWQTRSLSSVSGLPICWRCIRGWLMRLLWSYEHDFAAISPFLSERIGTLCCHQRWFLLLEQRTTGWRSGRSEGNSKSLSAGCVPTDLLLLMQQTSHPVPGMISLVPPTGRPAFHSVRHPRIGCRSQHWGMGLRPLRMKVWWNCLPRVLSPPPHRTQSWRPCLPGQPWVSGWRSTDRPVPNPRGWKVSRSGARFTTVLCSGAFFPGGAWGADEVVDGPFHGQKPLVHLLRPHYPRWRGCQGVHGHSPGGESDHLCPQNAATWRNRPRLPSKSCKLTAALLAKAYSAAGQAASALHTMVILHAHQAKALKQVHEGHKLLFKMLTCRRMIKCIQPQD